MSKKRIRKISPSRVFPKVEKMLYRLAWEKRNRFFTFEEARSEAYYAFMKACETYDPTRGMKITSWVWYRVSRQLHKYVARQAEKIHPEITDPFVLNGYIESRPQSTSRIWSGIQEMSGDAREMVDLLVNSPAEIQAQFTPEHPPTPKQLLKMVREHLKWEHGYDPVYLNITELEIESELESCWT